MDLIQQAASQATPDEACGLLFGTDGVDSASLTRNVASDPLRHFEIDPTALFAALRTQRAGGPRIAGYWHSHPSGDARPSVTDAAMAVGDGKLWLIVAGEAAMLWRAVEGGAVHGRFDRVETIIA